MAEELEQKIADLQRRIEELEQQPQDFEDVPIEGQRIVKDLEVGTIRSIVGKTLMGLLTDTQKTDLTDSGQTSLHGHAPGSHQHPHDTLSGLGDDDHSQYHNDSRGDARYLWISNTSSYTPSGDYHPSTKKYVDDTASSLKTYVDSSVTTVRNEVPVATAGDELETSDDTEENTTSTSPVLKKEIQAGFGGTFRIKFDLASDNASAANAVGQIYRNGSAVGTERTATQTHPSYDTFSEDIADWTHGDSIQLYARTSDSGERCWVRNFRIYSNRWAVTV